MNEITRARRRWEAAIARSLKTATIADAFRAGWIACSRAEGLRQLELSPPASGGPAWVPVSGEGETRDTSREAATQIAPRAQQLRTLVLEEIRRRPGTDQQIATRLGLAENTVRPRRVELRDRGLVYSAGTIKTRAGRNAAFWFATGDHPKATGNGSV